MPTNISLRRLSITAASLLVSVLFGPAIAAAQSGTPFNTTLNISNTAGQPSDLVAVTHDGATTTYVVWREETPAGTQQIRLRRSTNGAMSFADAPAGRIAATVAPGETVYALRAAGLGSQLYVLYTSGVEPRLAKARLVRSADGGATFDPAVTLAESAPYGGCAAGDLVVDGAGVLHVVCEDRDASERVQYLVSSDGGLTFSDPVALSDESQVAAAPRIAVRDTRVAVVWEQRPADDAAAARDIAFLYSSDGAATFASVSNVSETPGASRRPAVAIGTRVQIVWLEDTAIVTRNSVDGVAFSPTSALAAAPAGGAIRGAEVGSVGNTVHAVWTSTDADDNAHGPFYRRSTNGGDSFAAVQDVRTDVDGTVVGVPAVMNTTQVRIAWSNSATGTGTDGEILLAVEPICGVSWAAPVSGAWNVAANWSPAVIPSAGSHVCILAEGNYTVTAGSQSALMVTVGHATAAEAPTLRLNGTLTVGSATINHGHITFGSGGHLNSATTSVVVVNTTRGRISTAPGAAALLTAVLDNDGEVTLGANLTTSGTGRAWTNRGTWRVDAGATQSMGTSYSFIQEAGSLTVNGTMNLSSADFHHRGGHVDGVVTHLGGVTRAILTGGTGGEHRFRQTNQGELYGRVGPTQTIRLFATPSLTTAAGNAQVSVQAGVVNDGTIVLTSDPATGNNQSAILLGGAGTFVSNGTILVEGSGGGRRIDLHLENHGLLDIGTTVGFSGTSGRTLTNYGTVAVAAGANVSFGANFVFTQNAGVIQNAGHVELSGEFSTGGDWFHFNGGTIEGVILVRGHSNLRIGPGSTGAATFHFENNRIFSISNNATFGGNIAPAQTLRIRGTQAGSTAQSGFVIAANGFTNEGTMIFESASPGSGGTSFEVTSGTLVNRGTVLVGAVGPVKALRGHFENRGVVNIEGDVSFQLANRTLANFGDFTVAASGKITLAPQTTVNQNDGVMRLDGPIELATEFSTVPDVFNFNGGDIVGDAGVHLTSTSRLNLLPGALERPGLFVFRERGNTTGATMTGDIGPLQTVRIVGCCGLNQGQTLTAANGFTNFGTIVMTTEAPTTNGAGLTVSSGTLVNRGGIVVEDPAGASTHGIQANIENQGRILINDTVTWSRTAGAYINVGTLTIASGRTLTLGGSGTFRNFAPGSLDGGGQLTIAAGSTFIGVGTLGVNVANAGRLRPGGSPGILAIDGNYTQTGTLEIEIAGSVPGSEYDRLDVTGAATLGGTLTVIVAPTACVHGTYTVMTYGSVGAADFATKTGLTGLAGGRSLAASKQPTEYLLMAVGAACNDAPVGADDSYTTDEDMTLAIGAPGVLANDTDANGEALTAILVSGPSHGTVTLLANGGFTYVPAADYHGTDSFTYRAGDGQATSGVATVTIQVNPVPDPPVAIDDSVELDEDSGPFDIDVLANDSVGPDGGALAIASVTPASHGTVAIVGSVIRYEPALNFNGADSFTYTIDDGLGGSATASVAIVVRPVNDPPTLAPVADQNVSAGVAVAFVLSAADVDGDALTFSASGLPAGATLDPASGAFAWTPAAADAGTHHVTFTVTDPDGLSAARSMTIVVTVESDPEPEPEPEQWPFEGFFAPVKNAPAVNFVQAGSAVPLKFSVGGDRGLNILAAGSPRSVQVSCSTGEEQGEPLPAVTAGDSSLQYDPETGQYSYIWKTERAWAGTCRLLIVAFADGSTHTVSVRFK